MKNSKTLEEITHNVMSRVKYLDICLPTHYLKEFKSEVEDIDNIEDLVSEEIIKDLDKSKKIIESTELVLKKTIDKVSEINQCCDFSRNDIAEIVKQEMTSLLEKLNDLNHELHFDELTGAKNRRWLFKEFLTNEKMFKTNGVMAFMDLNDFKNINDKFGHITGDKALIYFVSFIKNEVSKYTKQFKIVRFAGDEFILLFNDGITKLKVKNILESISHKIEKQKLKPANTDTDDFFKIGFSYGIVDFYSGDCFNEVIENADFSMYEMKSLRKKERGETNEKN